MSSVREIGAALESYAKIPTTPHIQQPVQCD
jgi:hypothetical protein